MKAKHLYFIICSLLFSGVAALTSCSGERGYIDYRGMSMGMSARQMADSLLMKIQNLAVDTNKTGETNIVMVDTLAKNFMVTVYHQNDTTSPRTTTRRRTCGRLSTMSCRRSSAGLTWVSTATCTRRLPSRTRREPSS